MSVQPLADLITDLAKDNNCCRRDLDVPGITAVVLKHLMANVDAATLEDARNAGSEHQAMVWADAEARQEMNLQNAVSHARQVA